MVVTLPPMLTHKILDDTLKRISEISPDRPEPENSIFLTLELQNLSNRDKLSILNKLQKDGYIDVKSSIAVINTYADGTKLYFITFDGLILLQEGGYLGKRLRKEEKTYRQNKTVRNTLALTRWVAIGTCLAALVSLVNVFLGYQKKEEKAQSQKVQRTNLKTDNQKKDSQLYRLPIKVLPVQSVQGKHNE